MIRIIMKSDLFYSVVIHGMIYILDKIKYDTTSDVNFFRLAKFEDVLKHSKNFS